MPTLGPSLLFAAGLTLGVGAGVLFPRKKEEALPVLPPPSYSNQVNQAVTLPSGSVRLQGGFPGETQARLAGPS